MVNGEKKWIRRWIIPELYQMIDKERKDNGNIISNKIAQLRIVNMVKQTKQTFELPKYRAEFDLRRCHVKHPLRRRGK